MQELDNNNPSSTKKFSLLLLFHITLLSNQWQRCTQETVFDPGRQCLHPRFSFMFVAGGKHIVQTHIRQIIKWQWKIHY